MFRWRSLTAVLLASACLPAFAQDPYSQGPYPPGGGVDQAGWITGKSAGPSYAPVYGPPGPPASGPGSMTYVQLPDDKGGRYEGSPFERALVDTFRHGTFRLEYLLWDISDPGTNVLGSATNFVADPTVPFQLTLPGNINPTTVVAPTLRDVLTAENNGIRGTYVLPFADGAIEARVFALATNTARVPIPELRAIDTTDIDGDLDVNESINLIGGVANPALLDFAVPAGSNFIVWDQGYSATVKTRMWGTEGNWLGNSFDPNSPLQIRPIIGIRYMEFGEDLRQRGNYNFTQIIAGAPVTTVEARRIDATTLNNLYGPQIGFRAELVSKWFDVGAAPKLMMGVNSYKSSIETFQVLSPTDPAQNLLRKDTTFGVLADLEVFSKIHVRENFSIFVAYNLMWAGLVTRPADNIIYNISSAAGGAGRTSNFVNDVHFSGLLIQGINIGGELRF